jgi:hypothetical protein
MVGDCLGGTFRPKFRRLEEAFRRNAEPVDDPAEISKVRKMASLDSREGVERHSGFVSGRAKTQATPFPLRLEHALEGVDVDWLVD